MKSPFRSISIYEHGFGGCEGKGTYCEIEEGLGRRLVEKFRLKGVKRSL